MYDLIRPQNHECYIDPLNNWHIRCVPEVERKTIDEDYQKMERNCTNCPSWTYRDSDYKAYYLSAVNKAGKPGMTDTKRLAHPGLTLTRTTKPIFPMR